MKNQQPETRLSQSHLLQTKLHRPATHTAVGRPRLTQKLNTVVRFKLVLISASAGYGKTTLAADWLAQLRSTLTIPVQHAWLSLDENDHELSRFLAYLIAALQKIDPHIGRGLQTILYAPNPVNIEVVATALINDLVAMDETFSQHIILVLDDYHLIDNPRIDEALTFLLDHLPANLHLVLLSRIDPALPLARYRAKGQLLEIRERELCFDSDETRNFFNHSMQLGLTEQDIQRLASRTEGWIAGLQLVGLALQSQGADSPFVSAFSGTHRYILDYLTDEVFQRQPPDFQRFLLNTSILNRMNADLCDAVCERSDSQAMLEALEHANLFIIPLDERRQWYRYHHLFADLLRQRLRQHTPESVERLHERASRWYAALAEASGDEQAVDEAIFHALTAGNYSLMADWLNQFGSGLWERGAQDKLGRWLSLLPPEILSARPALTIFQSWLDFTGGRYAEAEAGLNLAEQRLTEQDSPELLGRIAAVRAFIATFSGKLDETIQFAETALKLLARHSTWRGSAAIALGDAYGLSGNSTAASQSYQEALKISHAAGNLYLALNAGFKLATIHQQHGRLHQAFEICSEQIALAEKSGLAQTAAAGCLFAVRGDILCEWDQLAEGLAQTQQAVDASAHSPHVGFVGWIMLYRIRSLLTAREFGQAEDTLNSLDSLAQITPLPPWITAPIRALRVLVWLAQGETEPIITWAKDSSLSADSAQTPGREFDSLLYAKLWMLQERHAEAEQLLDTLLNRPGLPANLRILILLTRTQLFQHGGNPGAALDTLAQALALGEKGGFIRSFTNLGTALVPVLKAALAQGVTPDYTRGLLRRLAEPAPVSSLDALSEREREVLVLIASGLKNQQIAEQLVISLNTVLYHTKNIYSKLNVTHRTQAVQRAREQNLL